MASNNGTPRDEEQQNDLMAALASARELGPDMDKAIVASYLEKQKQQTGAQPPAQQQAQQQQAVVASQGRQPPWPVYLTPALGIIAFIALLVVSGGHLWWMFWLIPAFGGWGWWGSSHQDHEAREARMQRRMDRYEWRRARYGYRYGPRDPYDNGYGSAPTQQPQQVQPPASQQAQSPTEYD